MQDIVNLCTSALMASTAALKNTSNNLANMNTAGFRGTHTTFASLFDAGTRSGGGPVSGGVTASATTLNMKPGSYVTTGNSLDLAVMGEGFFVLKDASGHLSYTRDGQFAMRDNKLVAGDGSVVQALGENGQLTDISVDKLMLDAGKPTTTVTFGGSGLNILKSDQTTPYTTGITVFDAEGGSHALTLAFTPKAASSTTPADPTISVQWTVSVQENGKDIGSPIEPFVLRFGLDGSPLKDGASFDFEYKPLGLSRVKVKVDCSNIQSFSGTSALTPVTDGQAGGALQLANLSFDESGVMQLSYDNGQKGKGPVIALAMTDEAGDWTASGASRFEPTGNAKVRLGTAGDLFGTITAQQLEGSNVDMSAEFSDMITAQRMYQSASQVIQATNTLSDALLRAAGGR